MYAVSSRRLPRVKRHSASSFLLCPGFTLSLARLTWQCIIQHFIVFTRLGSALFNILSCAALHCTALCIGSGSSVAWNNLCEDNSQEVQTNIIDHCYIYKIVIYIKTIIIVYISQEVQTQSNKHNSPLTWPRVLCCYLFKSIETLLCFTQTS